ncbi:MULTISPECIES: helix-turn-helix domain-containing protein [unclassified Lentilitoribacter]|uniref:helix-turn-helix domain-containing protein n=1 Tax=unclassified Lentilitoribacter TaxID=2647570 RepID=UPI0013A6B806|nr:AraC family transcriptional regulator [Lentilitoribacter sp. Alg239-R112]
MSILLPELEYVDRATETIRYLEHGWPTNLCRWHSHAEYELHLVVATRGKAFVGDYIGEFVPGSLFMTGPQLPHNWVTDEVAHPEPVEIRDMMVQFSQESVDKLAEAFPEFQEMEAMFELAKSGIEFTGFNPIFAKGHLERIRSTRGSERIVAFLRFLVRVNEHVEKLPLSVAGMVQPEGNSKQARIAEVIDHITKHFAEDISVEMAAEMARMSSAAFSRNFQRFTGNKFVEFVNRIRISQACSMLYSTDEQVASICFSVGFHNLANFNRHFLKMKNMTPTEYRDLALSELAPKQRFSS